jgi:intracellular septation protein A
MADGDAGAPWRFLWETFRALLPTLLFDVGGTMLVYYLLVPHFSKTSVWPLVGASLVPTISNIITFVKRQSIDIVGLLILIGLIAGVAGALFGGGQRLLLVRESLITGVLGLVLFISPFVMRRPIGYYVMREFLTANEALPHEHFDILWRTWYFRQGVRVVTIAWGALLLGEFVLRVFMALRMNIAFVLGASPFMFTVLMLIAGAITAVWLGSAITRALRESPR